ncbi:MAG: DUF2764 domain-containing protein [Candidatus Marinimicrobia bacterium]|nr:DUF2764 domain-containing protein [Candidatus Neomarinimicrobiota bacterium]
MDRYYYLAAQLPALYFDKEPFMTVERFLYEAQKWLIKGDLKALKKANINTITVKKSDLPILKEYILYEFALRNELVQYRQALRNRQEHKPLLFPVSVLKEGNPLDVEKKLLRLRWQVINELEFGHYSDIEFLALYYLKLQILRRLQYFDKDTGKEKFKTFAEIGV